MRVALIIDGRIHGARVARFFKNHGLRPVIATSVRKGLVLARKRAPGLILFNWRSSGDSARSDLKIIRHDPATAAVPVVAISDPSDSPEDEAHALSAGADFFLTKDELWSPSSRSKKILFRHFFALILLGHTDDKRRLRSKGVYHVLNLDLDVRNSELLLDGKRVHLGPKELRLLECFLRRPNVIRSARYLWARVWDSAAPPRWAHTLAVTVSSLRQKLGAEWSKRFVSASRRGYRLQLDSR